MPSPASAGSSTLVLDSGLLLEHGRDGLHACGFVDAESGGGIVLNRNDGRS